MLLILRSENISTAISFEDKSIGRLPNVHTYVTVTMLFNDAGREFASGLPSEKQLKKRRKTFAYRGDTISASIYHGSTDN